MYLLADLVVKASEANLSSIPAREEGGREREREKE